MNFNEYINVIENVNSDIFIFILIDENVHIF